jgi:uncharacterized protein YjiS (DUF1127 family)
MSTRILKSTIASPRISLSAMLSRSWTVIDQWRERARQRRHLAEMSTEMLADIGISASAARAEAGKPFWIG